MTAYFPIPPNIQIENINEKIVDNNHPDLLLIKPENLNKVKMSKSSANQLSEENNLGVIKIDSTGNPESYIYVETCFKLPCSDSKNRLKTLIVSDMVTK